MAPPQRTTEEAVLFEIRGRVAIITLNQPEKLNACTQEHYFRIAQLLEEVSTMPEIIATVITGNGRFFSAGADVTISRSSNEAEAEPRKFWARSFVSNNVHNTRSWYTHPKVLITALNGPAVGLSAALTAHSDFVYAAPHAYLLTPFSSLGLVAEGGASKAFVDRLGISKANEALLTSRKVPAEDLLRVGYVNKIFAEGGGDKINGKGIDNAKFLQAVLDEINEKLGEHLNSNSIAGIKKLIRKPGMALMEQANMDEAFAGLDVFVRGIPQKEFAAIASGAKKHKL